VCHAKSPGGLIIHGRTKVSARLKYVLLAAIMLALRFPVRAAASDVTPSMDASSAESLYASHCAQCHGRSGKGDGPRAARLKTHIHSFADCDWMAMRSDATLFLIITKGRGAIGLPPEMPSFDGSLDSRQITELIGYVRRFCLDRSGVGGSRRSH